MKSKPAVAFLQRDKVPWRIRMLSRPKADAFTYTVEVVLPELTPRGIRASALKGECSDRILDLSHSFLWRLFALKKDCKHQFSPKRLQHIEDMIEMSNATMYTKLANTTIDPKKTERPKSKAWTESDWKKHMDRIAPLATPKKIFGPRKPKKKKWKPLPQLIPRLTMLAVRPEFKVYRRLSKESWYRNPTKVSPEALKYVASERMIELSAPRQVPTEYPC